MIMNRVIFLVPVIASFVLGALYLHETAGNLGRKAAGMVVFLGAAYLQFFTSFVLAGVIIQVLLAILLELRRLYWDMPVPVGRSDHGQGD